MFTLVWECVWRIHQPHKVDSDWMTLEHDFFSIQKYFHLLIIIISGGQKKTISQDI